MERLANNGLKVNSVPFTYRRPMGLIIRLRALFE